MTVIDAETGLELSATGKITPKELSGAFKRVEKVYDGTTSVPSGAVGFDIGTPGGVVSGDVVTVKAGYGAVFESPNVKGSGTSRVIGGAGQHNWINYTNVELDGAQAGNYKITPDANGRLYGLGEITPFKLDSNTVINFGTVAQATKIYDGTYGVKRNESAAPDTVKGYIEKAEVQVGTQTLNLYDRMSVTSATYDVTKDVNNGISQRVTYNLTYTPTEDGNIVLAPNAVLKAQGTGVITKRDVTVTVKSPLTKQYDAGTAVKDASGNVITGAALNNLVALINLTGNDNATYTTTAVYTNENVGTNKQVKYEVTLDAASAGNYNLKHNGGNGNAFKTFDNVIEKRKVKVNFKDVSKTYDTTTANPDITGFVSDADAQVLNTNRPGIAQADPANNNKYKLQNLGALTSSYGAGDTDATFNANADAGANKDVQYAGLRAAMNNTLGGAASNYEFDVNGYGKGVIGKKTLNDGDVAFNFDPLKPVTKIYDGGRRVKYLESDKPADVKNYFTNAMWNGHNILDSLEVDTAEYDNKNVNGGAVHNITYKFKLSAANKNFELGTNLTKAGTGKITPKDLSGSFRKITKVYDGTTDVDPAAVGFEFGAVAAGDDLTLATHTESFQSPEIDGDGTTIMIGGSAQKNWINYSNLTLNGADAGNYTLASAAKGLGEIRSPRPAYYTPDAEYYKELTQTSRMIPNEYAYENASMDQSGHFGRDAEAEVAYRTPSVNMTMDGMDLSKSDILVTDRAVFAIVSEVFG